MKGRNYKDRMAFWDLLTVASMPVIKILLISALGAVLSTQYAGVLTEESRKKVRDRRL